MRRSTLFTSVLLSLTLVALFSLTLAQVQPTAAQTFSPTATPTDPLWRAFAAARDALEEKFNVDMTIVQNYEWSQVEFFNGIDSCVTLDDPTAARELYFGWRFVITALNGVTYEGRSSFDATIVTACDEVTVETAPAAGAPDCANGSPRWEGGCSPA